jgi:dihydropteroate synthase
VTQRLRLRGRELDLSQPVLMGIVNATPDSFSDRQGPKDVDELVACARELLEDGAAIVDVGGESGRTDTEPVPVEEEISRVAPPRRARSCPWTRGAARSRAPRWTPVPR